MTTSKKKLKPYEMSVISSFVSPSTGENEAAIWISVNDIDFAAKQPRRYFSLEKLAHLTTSIKENGVLEPLLVRPKEDGRYEVVAGERRLRASQKAELERVPCVVKRLSDSQAFEIAIIENLQRDDLNPVEETEAILDLLSIKLSQSREDVIAHFNLAALQERKDVDIPETSPELKIINSFFESIGRFTPNSFRTNRLPLLKIPSDIFEVIAKGEIEYSKGRLIARIKDESYRKTILKEALEEGLSQRVIQDRIESSKDQKNSNTPADKVITQMNSVLKKAKKAKAWSDASKRKQLAHYLSEIEKLMAED